MLLTPEKLLTAPGLCEKCVLSATTSRVLHLLRKPHPNRKVTRRYKFKLSINQKLIYRAVLKKLQFEKKKLKKF